MERSDSSSTVYIYMDVENPHHKNNQKYSLTTVMNGPNGCATPSSSMDLLQERFRQLQRARDMRKKRELGVWLLSGGAGYKHAEIRSLVPAAATAQHPLLQKNSTSSFMFDERRAPNCNLEDSTADHVDTSLHL